MLKNSGCGLHINENKLAQKKRALLFLPKAILLLTAFVLLLTGNFACQPGPYKTMRVVEGIQGVSFEYPKEYKLIHLSLENLPTTKFTEIGLSASENNKLSEIYVYMGFPQEGSSSADQIMEQLVNSAKGSMKDFNLSSDKGIMLNDNVARQVVFTADSSGTSSSGNASASRPATYRVTSFVYSGLAVEIDMTCDQSMADTTEAVYQHVIDTFSMVK